MDLIFSFLEMDTISAETLSHQVITIKYEYSSHTYSQWSQYWNVVLDPLSLLSATDMALLSLSDHSIITYGTFGMWGALLANRLETGETILSETLLKTGEVSSETSKLMMALEKHNVTNWTFL